MSKKLTQKRSLIVCRSEPPQRVNGAEEKKNNDHPTRLKVFGRMWISLLDFDLFGKGDDKVSGLKSSDIQEAFALHVHNFINADRTSIGLFIQFIINRSF